MTKTTPHIRVHHHNDYLISFYAGRDQSERHLKERNWLDDSALKLGTAMYAIHSGAEAVVYDTFASVAHAEFVRSYLEQLGIRKFTAILSHGTSITSPATRYSTTATSSPRRSRATRF
jgi:cyclase